MLVYVQLLRTAVVKGTVRLKKAQNELAGTDLGVGLVGLGPGPPLWGAPTKQVLGLIQGN